LIHFLTIGKHTPPQTMATQKLILALTLCLCLCHCRAIPIKVKLSDVKAITLTAGKCTTGRRSAPVLQQQCRGHLCNYAPTTIQCTNTGSDGLDAQWDCKADLPNGIVKRISQNGYPLKTQMLIVKVMTTPPTLIFWQAAVECPILSKVLPLTNRVHSQQGNRPQV